jgi:hypothetical protein
VLVRLLFVVFLLLPGSALAASTLLDDKLAAVDKDRLAAFDKARAEAISEAQAGGEARDLTTLEGVLAGEPQPIRGVDIRGAYRCRTVKLGGNLPLVVYDWFKCRIDEDDLGYRLVKSSGSQRFTGHFVDADEGYLVFWGAGHYGYEEPRSYGDDPEQNMVGRFVKVGAKRYRLEIPLPQFESKFDVIELEKR